MIGIKGELVLLEAARKCKEDITFVFVGSGPEAEKISAEAKINSKVVYLGRVSDDKMSLVYSAADIFISPVLYDEGYATVYLEALSCGTPVISTRRGCLPYFLTPEVSDLLDHVDDVTVLRAVKKHYKNKELLVNKRVECTAYAERNFSENNAQIILDSYT
jgi:glycosyltransferase involved in cell wall biosynthesis